jgi:hypothetical protein
MITLETAEDERQWQMLRAPLGERYSGRARYAAAMHFYNRTMLDADTLEAFRVCAKDDFAMPVSLPELGDP